MTCPHCDASNSLRVNDDELHFATDQVTPDELHLQLADARSRIRKASPQMEQELTSTHQRQPDVVEKLSELAQLHQDGLLTETEFAEAKAKLLA